MFGYPQTTPHFQQYHPHHRHRSRSPPIFDTIHPSTSFATPPPTAAPPSRSSTPAAFFLDFLAAPSHQYERDEEPQQTLQLPCGIQAHQCQRAPSPYPRAVSTSGTTARSAIPLVQLKQQYEAYQAYDADRRAAELRELQEKQSRRRAEEEKLFIAKLQAAAVAQAKAQAEAEAEARARVIALALAKAKAEAEAREKAEQQARAREEQARLRSIYLARLQAEAEEQARIERLGLARQQQQQQRQEEHERQQRAFYFSKFLEEVQRQAKAQAEAVERAEAEEQKSKTEAKADAVTEKARRDSFELEKEAAQKLVDEWKKEQSTSQEKGKQKEVEKESAKQDAAPQKATNAQEKQDISPEDVIKSLLAQFGLRVVSPPPSASPSPSPPAAGPSTPVATSSSSSSATTRKDALPKGSEETRKRSPQATRASSPARSPNPTTPSPKPQQQPAPSTASSATPKKVNIVEKALQAALEEEYNENAILDSLKSLDSIRKKFEILRSNFVEPETLIFEESQDSTSTSMPSLAFNSINRPIKEYDETLLRVLTELDQVESHGSDNVKKQRKQLAVAIQAELDRVDAIKNAHWEKRLSLKNEKTVEQPKEDRQDEESQVVLLTEKVEEPQTDLELDSQAATVEPTPSLSATQTDESSAEELEAESKQAGAEAEQAGEEDNMDGKQSEAVQVTTAPAQENDPAMTTVEAPREADEVLPAQLSPETKVELSDTDPAAIEGATGTAETDDNEAQIDTSKDDNRSSPEATSSTIPAGSSASEESPMSIVDEHQPTITAATDHVSPSSPKGTTACKPTYAEVAKAKLIAEEKEAAARQEIAEDKSSEEDKKAGDILFEVESVSSQASDEPTRTSKLEEQVNDKVQSKEKAKPTAKSTTVSDEDDDDDLESESSFEMLH